MNKFAIRLKETREKLKKKDPRWTQSFVASKLGVARTTYTSYESGSKQPPLETVNKIADLFDVSTDFLYGRSDIVKDDPSTYRTLGEHQLTPGDIISLEKEEKDIAKRMEQIKKDLSSEDGLLFNGEPMSEEAVESFLEAMEYAVRQTQRINKKYIPKKYRDKEQK